MRFLSIYRVSFYLMLVFATLTLCVDAVESKASVLFPPLVAVAGIAAFLTVDRNPRFGLSRRTANVLALGSATLSLLEYSFNHDLFLLALAHWLIYLQVVKMFLPKTAEDDWFLFLLGLMQVLVGAVISQSDHVGLMLIVWAILALWVLALFSLHRDAQRSRTAQVPGQGRLVEPSRPAREAYPGLLDWPFVLSAARVTLLTLALGGVIFLVMPRRNSLARSRSSESVPSHMTGFDDEVQLGQLGEILENDSVVMSVEFYDDHGNRIGAPPEPLWRGVTMTLYENGRWHRQSKKFGSFPILASRRRQNRKSIRQQIKLEANDSSVLFGMRPMLDATAGARSEPELNAVDGTITRPDARPGTFDYRVISDADPTFPQPGELHPGALKLRSLTALPEPLQRRLGPIAERVVRGLDPDDRERRARALESYLRDTGGFTYSLHMEVADPGLDPVEDFLINRKQGHCEYFASGLTLMLRALDIPARMVNGFKGGDWNDLAKVLSVRQKHAHSWVEVYLGRGPNNAPRWLTLDPTPGIERDESVSRVGGFAGNFRQLTDLVRYVWVFYIVGFNSERQDRLIYEPIRRLIREARSGFAMMGQALKAAFQRVFVFQDVESFISPRGFVASFVSLLALAVLARGGHRGGRRLLRWYRGGDRERLALAASVAFYRRLVQLLGEFGLDRPAAETHREFARRATVFLAGQGSSLVPVAEIPARVVDAYYRVRFGRRELPPAALKTLEGELDALEASLRASRV